MTVKRKKMAKECILCTMIITEFVDLLHKPIMIKYAK